MTIYMKMVACAAAFAMVAGALFTTSTEAKPRRHYRYPHHAFQPRDSLRRAAGGALVDRNGWRYRPGYGWDNTCHNLDYMLSRYACTAQGHP
jgi:hypothetical protein